MSHTVTITRTTTTATGTPLFINSNYLCTTPGLLKLAQLLLGAACVGLVGYYWDHGAVYRVQEKPVLFFFLVSVACLVGTFCLVTACLVSLSTASIISKTVYEVIYHGLAFILYLAAGLTLIIEVNHQKRNYSNDYEPFLAASMLPLGYRMSNTVGSHATTPRQRISFNVDYLRRLPGQLKLAELCLGVVCVSVIAHHFTSVNVFFGAPIFQSAKLFFITTSVSFLIGTFCLLTSCLMSPTTATAISRTEYELVYHGIAFVLYLAASITLLVECNRGKSVQGIPSFLPIEMNIGPYIAASVMGILTSLLYLFSTYFAYNIYQGN